MQASAPSDGGVPGSRLGLAAEGAGNKEAAAGLAPPLPKHVTKTMSKLAAGVGRNPIEIGFTIYSLTNIDPVEQTFHCDLKVFCRWHDGGMELDPDMVQLHKTGAFANGDGFEKDEDGRFPHFVVKEIDPELVDNSAPHHHFTNAHDVEPVEGTHVVYLSPNDKPGYVRSEQRFRGTFFQAMQLAAFPFDAQTLNITIRLPRRSDSGRPFIQFHNSIGPQAEMKDWVRLAEWYRYQPTAKSDVDSKGRAKYTISVPLVRRYTYYVWSILAVIGSISFLSFVSFAINPDDLPGRSSLVVTLLLTAVAFKLVISDILPKVCHASAMPVHDVVRVRHRLPLPTLRLLSRVCVRMCVLLHPAKGLILDVYGLLHQRDVLAPADHLDRKRHGRLGGQPCPTSL